MMPGLQVRFHLCVTLTFDLLTHKVGCFVPYHVDHLYQDKLIRLQNIVFTSLVTDERTNERTS